MLVKKMADDGKLVTNQTDGIILKLKSNYPFQFIIILIFFLIDSDI